MGWNIPVYVLCCQYMNFEDTRKENNSFIKIFVKDHSKLILHWNQQSFQCMIDLGTLFQLVNHPIHRGLSIRQNQQPHGRTSGQTQGESCCVLSWQESGNIQLEDYKYGLFLVGADIFNQNNSEIFVEIYCPASQN